MLNKNKKDGRRTNHKAFDNLFPYLLDSRTDTSRPNVVWQMDFTHLDCPLESVPGSGHYLLLIIDTFNNCIICSKVFFLKNKRGTVTSNKLIKCLQQTIEQREITQELILNADRGSEFVSKQYYQFVSEHPFLEGSHSGPATPNHNAVVERMNRTFKTQTQQYPIPKTVAKTRDLQRFVDKKTHFLNNQFIHKRNKGNTAIELASKQQMAEIIEPEVILHRRETLQPYSTAYEHIVKYRTTVSQLESASSQMENVQQPTNRQIASFLVVNAKNNEKFHQDSAKRDERMSENLAKMATTLSNVNKNTTPKTKISHKAQIARDPLPETVYQAILNDTRPLNAHRLSWARFRVTSTVLFYTGLRVNEICYMTLEMMNDLRTKQKCSFYQSKVKKERAVLVPHHALQSFSRIREDIDLVYKDHTVLFPGEPRDKDESAINNNTLNTRRLKWPQKFPEMINKYLEPYAQQFNLKLTSHSFRINFVTDLLKHEVPTHVAQELVGHSDIRSTLIYKRYTTTDEDKMKSLSKPHAAREAAKKAAKPAKKAQGKTQSPRKGRKRTNKLNKARNAY